MLKACTREFVYTMKVGEEWKRMEEKVNGEGKLVAATIHVRQSRFYRSVTPYL
jgi:hypothetical protein